MIPGPKERLRQDVSYSVGAGSCELLAMRIGTPVEILEVARLVTSYFQLRTPHDQLMSHGRQARDHKTLVSK
jgi:hypothetical protein